MKDSRRLVSVIVLVSAMGLTAAVIASQNRSVSSLGLVQNEPQGQQDSHASRLRGPEPKGPVPKYGIVSQGKITRSGLPKDDEGWNWLRAQGTKTIINFRQRNEVDYQKYGFKSCLWIPLNEGRMPTDKEVKRYLNWIQDPANQPVNIQCAEGKDRTGMMVALARYAIEGWSMDDAINEASLYRREKPLAPYRVEWLRQWASKHPPGSHRVKQRS